MNGVTLKKLEFDKVANYAAQFCLSSMGRDRLLAALPEVGRQALVVELERVLELRNLLQEGTALPFSWLPDTRPLLKKLEILESYLGAGGVAGYSSSPLFVSAVAQVHVSQS